MILAFYILSEMTNIPVSAGSVAVTLGFIKDLGHHASLVEFLSPRSSALSLSHI